LRRSWGNKYAVRQMGVLMSKWSKRVDECANCGTARRAHKAGGYCTRCYPVAARLEKVKRWSCEDVRTLNGPALKYAPKPFFNSEQMADAKKWFEFVKSLHIWLLEQKLESYHFSEQQHSGIVTGLDLEYAFRRIASLCHVRNKNLLFGIAGNFDGFAQPQRRFLLDLLKEVLENSRAEEIRWRNLMASRYISEYFASQ